MFVQVYRYGESGLWDEQWKTVCERIGLDRPSEADWAGLQEWREWVISRDVRSQIRFNTDVALIDRKIAATLTKNRLNANRRETLDRRLSYLSPEDRARWLKIEQELFDVQEERQSAPVKQAEEVA